ncbi:hypothetical protein [Cohnella sp. GbtcB17]|uniref:hypothetical protein n=1 Tax=Cohnella sp. GbtcB17 TaxID=2824762 RepID=UPI001C30314C|nr:hypothetical protein [Cohnella sp. GbtcB17]
MKKTLIWSLAGGIAIAIISTLIFYFTYDKINGSGIVGGITFFVWFFTVSTLRQKNNR